MLRRNFTRLLSLSATTAKRLPPDNDILLRTASRPTISYSLSQLYDYGKEASNEKLMKGSRYTRHELITRIAKQIAYLHLLPYVLVTNKNVSTVLDLYHNTLNQLRAFPEITSMELDAKFTELLSEMFKDTGVIVDLMSTGLADAMKHFSNKVLNVDAFMDNMIRSRIGRRTLAEHHLALRDKPMDDWVGIICDKTSPAKCVERSSQLATELCQEVYGIAPSVEITGDVDATFRFIPFHLEYICVELLKNSMRAVCDKSVKDGKLHNLPPIQVHVASGTYEIVLRFSDEGGGIPRHFQNEVFRYGFTTVPSEIMPDNSPLDMNDVAASKGPKRLLAGKGFGLPMSRIYANFFGGSLNMTTVDGYGTDVLVRLDKTATTPEVLMGEMTQL